MTEEYILCAAIWFKDKENNFYPHQPKNIPSGFVLCGHRHGAIFAQFGMLTKLRQDAGIYEEQQGFLTNLNRFVGREEAAQIAFAADQTDTLYKKLFSEYLY
jgi:hypothetical protein